MEAGLAHEVEDDGLGCLLSQPFLFLHQGLVLPDEGVGGGQGVEEVLVLGSEVVDGVRVVFLS